MENPFLNRKPDYNKLLKFGFKKSGKTYFYQTDILNNTFSLEIYLTEKEALKTKLTEIETGEIYTLHLTDAEGGFVGDVRTEYQRILKMVSDECFYTNVFKFSQSYEIIDYIKAKYNDDVEYLWEKFPQNAVARRKDNSKWYLAILTVKRSHFGFKDDELTEVIDLRANPEEIPKLIQTGKIFSGYHMNKKHWISIILDGTNNIENIFKRIDESYILANRSR